MADRRPSTPLEAVSRAPNSGAAAEAAAERARQSRLWRAITGMLVALGLAVLIVTLEIHAQSRSRADHLHRQLDRAQSKVLQLQQALTLAHQEVADTAQELAAQQTLSKILMRSDTKLIHFTRGGANLSGFVALNQPLAIAAIAIDSKQLANQVAQAFWLSGNQASIAATQFNLDSHGRATAFVALPPFFKDVVSLAIVARSPQEPQDKRPLKPLLKADLQGEVLQPAATRPFPRNRLSPVRSPNHRSQ